MRWSRWMSVRQLARMDMHTGSALAMIPEVIKQHCQTGKSIRRSAEFHMTDCPWSVILHVPYFTSESRPKTRVWLAERNITLFLFHTRMSSVVYGSVQRGGLRDSACLYSNSPRSGTSPFEVPMLASASRFVALEAVRIDGQKPKILTDKGDVHVGAEQRTSSTKLYSASIKQEKRNRKRPLSRPAQRFSTISLTQSKNA
ncbi:hypothetical protein V8C42DRAFT_323962 [Trichoderma barbatum]